MSTQARAYVKYMEQSHNSGGQEKASRILAQCLKNFYDGNEAKKVQDCDGGREFLVNMFPSLSKRIRDAMKPCETRAVKLALKKKHKAEGKEEK